MTRRAYQESSLRAMRTRRMFAMLFERQAGKTTTIGDACLFEMMRYKARTCIYASASLLLAREIITKQVTSTEQTARQIIDKESQVLFGNAARHTQQAQAGGLQFATASIGDEKTLAGLTLADFTELFEAQRLEFRVYHDRNTYSRTQVIAPNAATARGWSGTVCLDEIGFIRDFKELWVAIEPIISTNPEFRLIMSTTPPQDDTHYCFELLAPPTGMEFKINPAGNWYESELGVPVLRADAYDTHAAGKKIYDVRTGKEITPQDAFARAINKDGWRINHGLQWMIGGSAACDLLRLKVAQERGIGKCLTMIIDAEADMDTALAWLAKNISPTAATGCGFDVATTTKDTSNPSVLTVVEREGVEITGRLMLVWKTKDPDIARERVDRVLRTIKQRPGGAARALAIDATNEKYFAEDMRKRLRGTIPVLMVVASETVEKPGLEKPTNWKEYLGDQYVAVLEDNHLTLPADQYTRRDHRLVKKDRGRFVCEPDSDGCHGDTFDGMKLGLHAVTDKTGTVYAAPADVGAHAGTTL